MNLHFVDAGEVRRRGAVSVCLGGGGVAVAAPHGAELRPEPLSHPKRATRGMREAAVRTHTPFQICATSVRRRGGKKQSLKLGD